MVTAAGRGAGGAAPGRARRLGPAVAAALLVLLCGAGLAAAARSDAPGAVSSLSLAFGPHRVLYGVAGDTHSAVACGEGVIFYSSTVHQNWWKAAGLDTTLAYYCVLEVPQSNQYLVGASDGSIWRSTNAVGSNFVMAAQAGNGAIRALAPISGGGLLAVGDHGQILRCADENAIVWDQLDSPVSQNLYAVANNGVSSVAVGDNGIILHGGLDGQGWIQVNGVAEIRQLLCVLINPYGQYLAFGAGGAMWKGQGDALAWSLVAGPTTTNLRGGTTIGPALVVVGDNGTIYYSSGGYTNWDLALTPTSSNLRAAVFTGADVLAAGDKSTVLWSELGLTWNTTFVPVRTSTWGAIKSFFQGPR